MSYPAWMAFAALSIIWGFPYFLINVAVTDVPPLMIAWLRGAIASLTGASPRLVELAAER